MPEFRAQYYLMNCAKMGHRGCFGCLIPPHPWGEGDLLALLDALLKFRREQPMSVE